MIRVRNNWSLPNKSGRKVCVKVRISSVTVLDLYFTIGIPAFTLTLFNFTLHLSKK